MKFYIIFILLQIIEVCRGHKAGPQPLKGEVLHNTLRYDYARVLDLSLLFYEAQRSGRLPADNRIPWRRDSCLQCMGPRGANLQGGYYTSGRSLKFTFPNAAALTVLAWSLIQRKAIYEKAGLTRRINEAVKWGADYLVQCNTGDEIVAAVGNTSELLNDQWLRPEHFKESRPVLTISAEKPGSDLCGEMAAALSASAIALKKSNPILAKIYLQNAKELFEFSNKYLGKYSESVRQVQNFYDSWFDYNDELCWAAVWLYLATKDKKYLKYAEDKYKVIDKSSALMEFSWSHKSNGVKVLLYQITKKEIYLNAAITFCDSVANIENHSPKGMFNHKVVWGRLRYSSNAAFLCFELGEQMRKFKNISNPYIIFTLRQIHYALGDSGRSFVVGFGYNWPKFVHHAGSSCHAPPEPCGVNDLLSKSENPNILYGALVGGPDSNDNYEDRRDNAPQNRVAVDYNAGFQFAVASLLFLHEDRRLPMEGYACKFRFSFKRKNDET